MFGYVTEIKGKFSYPLLLPAQLKCSGILSDNATQHTNQTKETNKDE